jgi:hypothetical protein
VTALVVASAAADSSGANGMALAALRNGLPAATSGDMRDPSISPARSRT